jgi:MinD-like ATPase involved in chromosome partitioning or flagellar assembly
MMPAMTNLLAARPDQKVLRQVIEKSIAVGSGKGGVGKTITACNLAIYFARKGLRVGLVDLDPLSDVASLLDLYESEQALQDAAAGRPAPDAGLDAYVLSAFRGLQILFPLQKLGTTEARGLKDKIYGRFLEDIDRRFDVLLFDMPAGLSYEDNLSFLPFMKVLILVTNPEPTAHASAGAYAKEVQRLYPGTAIRLWHNRYSARSRDGFRTSDVAGNYNRFVDGAERLTLEETALLEDFAFVPEDPALDLLQGEPNPTIHVLKCMRESLDYAHGRLLSQASRKLGVPPRIQDVVTFYVHHNPQIEDAEPYLQGLSDYLVTVLRSVVPDDEARKGMAATQESPFTPEEAASLKSYLLRVKQSLLRKEILRLEGMLADQIGRREESRGALSSRLQAGQDRLMDREIARFLVALNKSARASSLMRNQGVLLLFYFSLHKLFQSRTLVGVLRGLIPRRPGRKGHRVRDRFRQIRNLVERDPAYREQYLKTMKTLHVIVMKQIAGVAKTFELDRLVLRDGGSRLDARPYVKLLAAFLHETLYSGLSVIVGFDYRSAAIAFQDGAERLLSALSTDRGTTVR